MPSLNITPATPSSRQPRGAVKIYYLDDYGNSVGEIVPGWTSWEVDNNAYRSADTFRVKFSAALLPATRDINWLSNQANIGVEIFANESPLDPNNYVPLQADSLIFGSVDDIAYDPVLGALELTGRDLTAKLIDTKTSEHFKEKTSSQIAAVLAKRHGLGIGNIVATTKTAGYYYAHDHSSTTQEQSEWELLTYLANLEDFDVYVKGRDLYFQPRVASSGDYIIDWKAPDASHGYAISNVVDLRFTRALHIAKGVVVEVHSWNSKSKAGFSETWPRNAKAIKPGQAEARSQVYRYTFPGLDRDKAQQRAQSIYKQIVAHEMRLTGYLPADSILDCSRMIVVQGTGSSFDQAYYPESVMRSMSMSEGYRMNIRAKNTGPVLENPQ
ncbi:hypothetical protein ICN48_05755 [Polynucleobacter sp. JS-Safj-400b-B2]|uniref:hypothetical protein n=1 Tax=Polynucleobacter sp. JS-Safj-400b-B2 TaxID=2576921 RepID=UPI001C0C643C|nr:hypothetical protein [Polynucleobacter sp. JS-Safj-400b-B2]MBU3625739.1 hypothetical protein [Polynucleobacter sp. JS-Safj-400b-B2]